MAYMIRYTESDYKSTVDISVDHDKFKLSLSAPSNSFICKYCRTREGR